MVDFKIPEFTAPKNLDEIKDFDRNLNFLLSLYPDEIGTEIGGWVYDFTVPIAFLEAEMASYHIPEAMKQIFAYWAEGDFLDNHAIMRNLGRKEATHASGEVQITTNTSVTIPQGFVLSTAATDYNTAQRYIVDETVTINGTGTVSVHAENEGTQGNAAIDTVIIQMRPLNGITAVTNPAPIDGGTETEDDEALRMRLIEYDLNYNKSFIGNVYDYRMWAMNVDGIGVADVIAATTNDGVVTIVLTDMNNEPANSELIQAVTTYIMGENPNDMKRLAPVNAKLNVIAVEKHIINITADVKLEPDNDVEVVKADFIKSLLGYFAEAKLERVVRISEVGSRLIETPGMDDYSNLTINSGTANVELTNIQMPSVGTVTLNVV